MHPLDSVAFFVGEDLVDGHRCVGDGRAVGGVAHLGGLGQVAVTGHLVEPAEQADAAAVVGGEVALGLHHADGVRVNADRGARVALGGLPTFLLESAADVIYVGRLQALGHSLGESAEDGHLVEPGLLALGPGHVDVQDGQATGRVLQFGLFLHCSYEVDLH